MAGKHSQPNILFIMADQFRHDYLGCAAASPARTPNLDRVAARGARFTQCASNGPVCSPARIGLACGLQPCRVGALDNGAYLPASITTYYQRLRDYGFRVGCAGKLDLAKPSPYNGRAGDRPCVYGYGFTHPIEIEGKMHAGKHATPMGPYGFYLQERGLYQKFHEDYVARAGHDWVKGVCHDSVLPADAFADVYIGRRAVEWIEAIGDDFPWHFFVSFVGPHSPFDPPTEYAGRWRSTPMPDAIQDSMEKKPAWAKRRQRGLSPQEVSITRRQYCAAIEVIDDQIGAILEAVERRGMMDHTIILFSSDHGEMLGDHGAYAKSLPYEAALRVPLLAAGPGIAEGRTCDALVELIDVNPTICELAGLPPQEGIDARSFAPILRGETDQHRTEQIAALRGFECLRTQNHKLIHNEHDRDELYDLATDPNELNNIAAEQPGITRSLSARLRRRFLEGEWRR